MINKLLAVLVLSLLSVAVYADDVDDPTPGLVGAYKKANSLDDNMQRAAAFAAEQINQGDLVEIKSAESQVVAGTNYRFKLIIAVADGTQHIFNAIVFNPLPNTGESMQLVEYEDMGVNPTVQ